MKDWFETMDEAFTYLFRDKNKKEKNNERQSPRKNERTRNQ